MQVFPYPRNDLTSSWEQTRQRGQIQPKQNKVVHVKAYLGFFGEVETRR